MHPADDGPYVIGVDGGASKTLALLATHRGEILGAGQSGPSNYQNVGVDAAYAALDRAIDAACTDAAVSRGRLGAVCLGLAGIDRPEDRAVIAHWAALALPDVPVMIVNDAELILAAGTPQGWGVGLICGTGSIAVGRDPAKQRARADGWGHIMGDAGSGYAIGRAALRATMSDFDGRGPHTELSAAVLGYWHLQAPPDLVQRIYGRRASPDEIAALATVAEKVAMAGDPVADSILADAGRDLAQTVAAVVRKLELAPPVPCALAGGVLVRGERTRQALLAAAAGMELSLAPLQIVSRPAEGAVRLGCSCLKGDIVS